MTTQDKITTICDGLKETLLAKNADYVVWPCLACSLEAMKDFDDVPEGLILGLELRSMHRERYEEIRRQKERPAAYDVLTPGQGIK